MSYSFSPQNELLERVYCISASHRLQHFLPQHPLIHDPNRLHSSLRRSLILRRKLTRVLSLLCRPINLDNRLDVRLFFIGHKHDTPLDTSFRTESLLPASSTRDE